MNKEKLIIVYILDLLKDNKINNIIVSGYIASILKDAYEFTPASITAIENNDYYTDKYGIHIFGFLNGCALFIDHYKMEDDMNINCLIDDKICYYNTISNKLSFIQSRNIETFGTILKPLADDFTAIFYHTVLVWCKIIPPDDGKENRYWEIWLVYLNNKPIGICGLYTLHTAENLDELWLGWLGIIPEFRNLKLGSQIMEHLYVEAKKVGCKRIYSYVDKGGAPLNFYNKEGFKIIGTVNEYLKSTGITAIDGDDFESADDFVIMKKL